MTPKKNTPGSPKYAIPKHVADIALKYCKEPPKNVSRGIQEMEKIIKKYQPIPDPLIEDVIVAYHKYQEQSNE